MKNNTLLLILTLLLLILAGMLVWILKMNRDVQHLSYSSAQPEVAPTTVTQ